MNTQVLKAKVDDVISTLAVAFTEVEEIENKRIALEKSSYVNTEREKKISTREIEMLKKEGDIESQKKFIEEQNKNTQLVLNKITIEKEGLKGLVEEKRKIEAEKAQLEIEKKGVETLKKELEYLKYEKEQLAQERKLFNKEKEAIKEEHKLLGIREANIHTKEERLDKIERMTAIP